MSVWDFLLTINFASLNTTLTIPCFLRWFFYPRWSTTLWPQYDVISPWIRGLRDENKTDVNLFCLQCKLHMSYRDQVDQQMSSLHVNTRKTFTPEWPAIVVSFQRTLRHTHTQLLKATCCVLAQNLSLYMTDLTVLFTWTKKAISQDPFV